MGSDIDMDDSVFDDDIENDSDAFSPVAKPKAKPKAAVKKPAAPSKPKKLGQTTIKSAKAAAVPKKRAKPVTDDEGDADPDTSGFAQTPPSAKKQKKAAVASKKPKGVPLEAIENDSMMIDEPTEPKPKMKTATETYQKLTQLEHIIKRPDTYIGSVERTEQQMWVFNKETSQMEYRKVTFVPGLYKIFDEILVNAADNKQRDSSMSLMKVSINRGEGSITVENNGKGIPVEIHSKEGCYIPELVFGHLLAGSNFDDDEKKTVGGRNGYGAKLCNVFSTEFTLECQDSSNGKRYKQTWRDNMGKMDKAKISSSKTADFVRVTFKPDFARFGMPDGIDDDLEALLYRRVYDMAGTVRGVKVHLNDNHLKLDFKKYCEMYAKAIARERGDDESDTTKSTVILEDSKGHPRWEIAFAVSDGSFQQVSFVNSIATTQGGSHVNYVADMICESLLASLNKKKKGHSLKLNHMKNHIFIFVNCLITNPAFTSQTKEQLTTKKSQFGSKCELTDAFLKKVGNTEAIENILHFAEQKADKLLSKSDGSKRSRISNAKLVDANLAGTRHGHECTLILTEGDSARGLAVAGRAVLDPDRIGVYPLRGKMLNVRDASIDAITKNAEIQNIKQFLGLKHKQVYTDTKGLRYGSLMIMADQDHDGSHIKGLLINFLEVQFPSLLRIPDFFKEFITPIVKVWQGNPQKPSKQRAFFTQPQYEAWKETMGHEIKRWQYKYFKGLGTSSNEDAQVYFNDMDEHCKLFTTMEPTEAELFELVFSKKKADARKEWLGNFVPGTFLDHSTRKISYTDFVNRELILFSMADNMRSIPSVLDGMKPGQRKVVFATLKKNIIKDKKVVELAGYVSEQTAYHHGEVSLQQTIVGLAQNFVGSNNINVLVPSGNFGSRLSGGSDAASARYIYTRLSPFARKVFMPLDEPILEHQIEDGKKIEPKAYAPVLPMILVNGASGIGTGWSTDIPNYHPMDIVKNLKRRMGRLGDGDEEKPFEPMTPWFRGWKGTVAPLPNNRYQFDGIARIDEDRPNEVIVTELPIRMWTDDFKAKLEDVLRAEKAPSWIKDYKEFNDHQNVHFEIQLDDKAIEAVKKEGLLERFKLTKSIPTTNLVAFDSRGQIRKYDVIEDMLEEFYVYRLNMYTLRKAYLLDVYDSDFRKMSNQARFIKEIMDGVLVVARKKKSVVVDELRKEKYEPFPKNTDPKKATSEEEEFNEAEENAEGGEELTDNDRDYDYLLSMPIWSFTQERLDRLKDAIEKKKAEHDLLEKLSEKDLWCSDLDAFVEVWEEQLRLDAEITTGIRRMGRRVSKKLGVGKGRKTKAADGDWSPAGKTKAAPKAGAASKAAAGPKAAAKPKPAEQKTAQRFNEKFAGKPKKPSEGADAGQDEADDPFSDDDYSALKGKGGKKKADPDPGKKAEASAGALALGAASAAEDEDEDDDESVAPIAKPRGKRAAASKAKQTWVVDHDEDSEASDDDADDKLLGDVGALVKGIGNAKSAPGARADNTTGRLSLFAMSRPDGGNGAAVPKLKSKSSRILDLDSQDDTNYELLAKPSPHKASSRNEVDSFLSDDELLPAPKNAPKTKSSSSPSVDPKARKSASSEPVAKKPRARPAAVKGKAKDETAPVSKKKVTSAAASKPPQLSPAAKPPGAKQQKGGSKAKKDASDDDDDIAMDEDVSLPPRPAGRARPGRAAAVAAAKKTAVYVQSDSDDDDAAEDESGGDDDESDEFDIDESD